MDIVLIINSSIYMRVKVNKNGSESKQYMGSKIVKGYKTLTNRNKSI